MVDLSAVGGVQGLVRNENKTQVDALSDRRSPPIRTEEVPARAPDRVEISEEALSVAQAEDTARETRVALEQDRTQTLADDKRRVDLVL